MRKVVGRGINDASYKVQEDVTVEGGKRVVVWRCPYYLVWIGMLKRVYGGNPAHSAYTGCEVSPEWLTFSSFKAWLEEQPQHQDWLTTDEQFELDKDILYPGNKVYGPSTCVLVPTKVNSMFISLARHRSELPLGVSWKKKNNAYVSQITIDGKKLHLGLFENPMEAHQRYLMYKWSNVNKILEDYEDYPYNDPRVLDAIRGYSVRLSKAITEEVEFTG